ncbi:SNF2-related domain-containing protein [Tieghemostelium lacteum]|uniref:SNF2-related domain-containing protein n=1 Tax=Tieghemostelium lacteum TaxID=361077 RepID=A0A151ZKE2_TIELA|nr:SNF2-related domain-containing protein [Tieghemostelium lacteum]|eukprot:KYQ94406.1 SNF2-related domain-containing protein [Tieghemostelium lacteum]
MNLKLKLKLNPIKKITTTSTANNIIQTSNTVEDKTVEDEIVPSFDSFDQENEIDFDNIIFSTEIDEQPKQVTSTPTFTTGRLTLPKKPLQLQYNNNDTTTTTTQNSRLAMTPVETFQNNYRSHYARINLSFELISETLFSCMGCDNDLVLEVFRSIPNSSFETFDNVDWWKFPVQYHNDLISKLKPHAAIVNVSPLPEHILKIFVNYQERLIQKENISVDLSRLPVSLLNTLMPFQRIGIEFGVKQNGRLLVADEMGLGKTIQALGIALYYREEWPLLIITPSSLKLPWADQIDKFLGQSIKSTDINLIMSGKCGLNGLVNIMSYDLVSKKVAELKEKNFKVVICDESHFIKHFATARTRAVLPVLQCAKRAILLSGTPALSRPNELYSQLNAIRPWFQPFQAFGVRYCAGYQDKFGWNYSGHSNMRELNLYLGDVMIRRLKDDVLTELPEKRRERIKIPLDSRYLRQIKKTFEEIRQEKKSMSMSDILTARESKSRKNYLFVKLFSDIGMYKLPSIRKLLDDRLESMEGKFIIFAHHANVMDGISDYLNQKKVQFIRIDGKTRTHSRNEFVKMFQDDENVKVALLSITAAGTGLTLTAANLVIFAELFWTPGMLFQAEDRAHRIGQVSSVLIQYLVGIDTVDEVIWDMIENKKNLLGQVIDGESNQTLNAEDSDIQINNQIDDNMLSAILQKADDLDKERTARFLHNKTKKGKKENDYDLYQNDDEENELFDNNDNEEDDSNEFIKTNTSSLTIKSTGKRKNNANSTPKKKPTAKSKDDNQDEGKKRKVSTKKSTSTSNNSIPTLPSPKSSNGSSKSSAIPTSPINSKSIEVDMEEDFEDLCHIDISQFNTAKDDSALDKFLFQPKSK